MDELKETRELLKQRLKEQSISKEPIEQDIKKEKEAEEEKENSIQDSILEEESNQSVQREAHSSNVEWKNKKSIKGKVRIGEDRDLVALHPSRRNLWISVVLVVAAISLAYFFFNNYAKLSNYSVVWTRDIPKGSFVGYERFGENLLKYSKDATTYLNRDGKTVWTEGYEMDNPFVTVNGDFIAVGDRQKNTILIFNIEGKTGTITTINPISRMAISKYGVVATIEEDASSSYINFYSKDGSKLDITIKSKISGDGYPTDLSLSPEGTSLMVSYSYIKEGKLCGRVVFYDFTEVGKGTPNRIVAGIDKPFTESIIGKVHFINTIRSFAVADTGIYFFSSKNPASPRLTKEIQTKDIIESIAYSDRYIAMVCRSLEEGEGKRLEVYNTSGGLVFKRNFDKTYKYLDIDKEYIFLYTENLCTIFNSSGTEKFTGIIDFDISILSKDDGNNRFVLTGPSQMKCITLK